MTMADAPVVFLLDCDNTLLDNDALKADVDQRLMALLGPALAHAFWELYEAVRLEADLVNYPVVLERFAALCPDAALRERVRAVVMDYPFAGRIYPDTPATLTHLRAIGRPAILSDGDPFYQPLKIERSGLADEVDGRVLVYAHKEEHLEEVMARWPGSFYVAVDDKARILAEMKRRHPRRFVTIHVRQGHYGAEQVTFDPAPDVSLAGIGDLCQYAVEDLRRLARG